MRKKGSTKEAQDNRTRAFASPILKMWSVSSSAVVDFYRTRRHRIQGVSRLEDINAGGDFLGLCDQKISYKHVSDFGRLRSYGHFLIPVHALV